MTDNDYGKILSGLHEKILNDEEMLQKVDHIELHALGMMTSLFRFQEESLEQWKEEANKYQALWCDVVRDIQTAKSEAIREVANKFWVESAKILDTDTLFWIQEIKNKILKEMVGD